MIKFVTLCINESNVTMHTILNITLGQTGLVNDQIAVILVAWTLTSQTSQDWEKASVAFRHVLLQ